MNELWLLDTHIWIRLLNGDPLLQSTPFLKGIHDREESGKIRIAASGKPQCSFRRDGFRFRCRFVNGWNKRLPCPVSVLPLSPEIAADSCFLPGVFHGDPADHLITASSRVHSATLVTFDQAILAYAAEGWVKAVNPLNI